MNERQQQIVKMIAEEHSVKVNHLAEYFRVTTETSRRDLKHLEKLGYLMRIHGGAVGENPRAKETGHQERTRRNMQEKIALARLAADYVKNGDTIAMGNGTTMYEMAKALHSKEHLTVITNSLEVGMEIVHNDTNKVCIPGGFLRKDGMSVSGTMSCRFLEEFRVDKCFFSVGGINESLTVTDFHVDETVLIQSMMSIAHKKIGLMDHSKLNKTGLKKICDVKDLDVLLVDWKVPIKDQYHYREAGVRVVAASPSLSGE